MRIVLSAGRIKMCDELTTRLNLLNQALEIVNYNPTTFSFLYTMKTLNVNPELIKIIKEASEVASASPYLMTADVIKNKINKLLEFGI